MSDLADKIREQAPITGEMIIKADSRTGSTHMTDREEWGRLMAEQLAALSREVVLELVAPCEELAAKVRGYFTNRYGELEDFNSIPAKMDGDGDLYETASKITQKIIQPGRKPAAAERQMKRGSGTGG